MLERSAEPTKRGATRWGTRFDWAIPLRRPAEISSRSCMWATRGGFHEGGPFRALTATLPRGSSRSTTPWIAMAMTRTTQTARTTVPATERSRAAVRSSMWTRTACWCSSATGRAPRVPARHPQTHVRRTRTCRRAATLATSTRTFRSASRTARRNRAPRGVPWTARVSRAIRTATAR